MYNNLSVLLLYIIILDWYVYVYIIHIINSYYYLPTFEAVITSFYVKRKKLFFF